MSETPQFRLEGVCRNYGGGSGVLALSGVDLDIFSGEFLLIMGPSGCGKSTLMNVIGCLDRPSSGRYVFEGRDTQTLDDDHLAEIRNGRIGFVFQSFNLLGRFTALENVMVPLYFAGGLSRAESIDRAEAALRKVGLGKRAHHRPNALSGGECQRVALARALINDPSILIADEPTGSLDSRLSREIMELFSDLNRRGQTIVAVTHDEHLSGYATRIVTMRDGRIAIDATPGTGKV